MARIYTKNKENKWNIYSTDKPELNYMPYEELNEEYSVYIVKGEEDE